MELYSKRKRQIPAKLSYDHIPERLKNQIVLLWEKFFNQERLKKTTKNSAFEQIEKILCEEHGKQKLVEKSIIRSQIHSFDNVRRYFESLNDIDTILDVIEVIFKYIEKSKYLYPPIKFEENKKPDNIIIQLNNRFIENGIGYQFDKMIIKIDNNLLHQNIINKTINLLSNPLFENANEEYIKALEHYRHDRYKECLNECLKSFETVMKIICDKNNWNYSEKDTVNKLVKICIENNIIPKYLDNYFTGIRTILTGSVNTIRNKNSGHGQGVKKIDVPIYLASFMLYLTGTTINFLISADESRKNNKHIHS